MTEAVFLILSRQLFPEGSRFPEMLQRCRILRTSRGEGVGLQIGCRFNLLSFIFSHAISRHCNVCTVPQYSAWPWNKFTISSLTVTPDLQLLIVDRSTLICNECICRVLTLLGTQFWLLSYLTAFGWIWGSCKGGHDDVVMNGPL